MIIQSIDPTADAKTEYKEAAWLKANILRFRFFKESRYNMISIAYHILDFLAGSKHHSTDKNLQYYAFAAAQPLFPHTYSHLFAKHIGSYSVVVCGQPISEKADIFASR